MKRGLAGSLNAPYMAIILAGRAQAASQYFNQLFEKPDTLGQVTSLSVDAAGDPRIAYWGPMRQDLRYAVKSGGVWSLESADSTDVRRSTAGLICS